MKTNRVRTTAGIMTAAFVLACSQPITGMAASAAAESSTENTTESVAESTAAGSDAIATEGERAPKQQVGREGMFPVTAESVKEGTYPITVESSSSMFKIVEAQLTVENAEMTAVLTLSGKGYLRLYMGTAEKAVSAQESEYAEYVENAEGMYTYEIPVEALDEPLDCASFSKKKEKWYDHEILFDAYTLPEEALLIELPQEQTEEQAGEKKGQLIVVTDQTTAETQQPAPEPVVPLTVDLEDGSYQVSVTLSGGSGRASIASPALMTVTGKQAVVQLEWSSSNYDYMKLGEETYYPVQTEGNSVFELPVTAFDSEVEVIADTTAMSQPHEITYTILLDKASVQPVQQEGTSVKTIVIVIAVVLICALLAGVAVKTKKKGKN